jgi:general secretion pathway protein J
LNSGAIRAAGFTLVELLIALAMIALITLLLFSGLRLGSRAWEAVDASAERTGAMRLANEFLERTLSQVRPATLVVEAETVSVFAGDAERLEFAAPLSEHVGVPGIYVLRLALEGSGERRDLVLTRWLMHPEILEGKDDIPAWKPLKEDSDKSQGAIPADLDMAGGAFGRTLLLEDVETLAIAYYGTPSGELGGALGGLPGAAPTDSSRAAKPGGSGARGLGGRRSSEPGLGDGNDAEWYDEWLDQSALPLLVRIRIATPDRTWPDLIVALPARRT